MMPFGGGSGRVGRSRMRLDEMDCADIMMKAVQRKRSRSIARRESFSGTEDDLKKFRDAVEANEKEDLQKDIDEYAVKVRELRGDNIDKNSSAAIKKDSNDIYLDKSPTKENGVEITSTNLEKDTAIVSKQNDKTKFEENEPVNTDNNKVISKTNNNQVKSDPSLGSGEKATEDLDKLNEYLQFPADNAVEPIIVRDEIAQENKEATNVSSNQQEQNVNENLNAQTNESFIPKETPSDKAVFDEKGKSNIADENNVDVPKQTPKEDTENFDNEYIPLNHPIIKSSHIIESKNNAENSNADETNDNDKGIEKDIEDNEIQNVQNIEHPIDVNENILIENVNESKIINITTEKKDTDETNEIVKEIEHDIKDKETQDAQNTEHTIIVNENNLIDNVNESKITNITTEREETDIVTKNTKSNDNMLSLEINANYPKDANESKITNTTSEREEIDIVTENTKLNENLVSIEKNDNDPENVTVPDNGESLCPDSEKIVNNDNNEYSSMNHIDQEKDTLTDISIANEKSNGSQDIEKHELAPEEQKAEIQNKNGSSDLQTKPSKCEDIATSLNGTSNESSEKDPNFLSIVDRIKSDITTLKTLSKQGTKTSVNIDSDLAQKEVLKANSIEDHDHNSISKIELEKTETLNNPSGDHKQSGLKVALDRVCREKSASHIQIPKELSSHLINLSSANISEQLKRSCSNIVAHTMEQELSKEFLLKKLEELLKEERKQVVEDLKRRKEQLQDVKSVHTEEINSLKQRQNNEIRNFHGKHSIEFDNIENNYLDHIEELRKEIEFLENEKQNMKSPNQIITDCLSGTIRLVTCRCLHKICIDINS